MKDRKTVLVVDDTPVNIQILVEVLKDECMTIVATNGERALRLAAKDPAPDIILLDIMMPGMDGYETCARLKADEKTRDIPVIFVTAKSEVEDELKGFELGAVDYITKPISPPVVKARVRTHLALKEAREDLARQNEELREAARLREDVENITRHDLKGPLNSIIGLPQIMLQEGSVTGEQAEHLKVIEESGYRMLRMINLSLDLFKMERGIYHFEPSPVDVQKMIGRIFSENRGLASSKNISLALTVQGEPPQGQAKFLVQGEELLCYSMFSNLIKNAIEASPEGKTVSVNLSSSNGGHVEIHNMGTVPEKIRSTFFEKYATAGKKGGTGLGTYSARLIAEVQGGTIGMETSEDEGTTITVTLRLATQREEQKKQASDNTERRKKELFSALERMPEQKILLVDDEPFNLRVLEKYLSHPRLILSLAENGRVAYEKHCRAPYDFIFMDVEMPVMNGVEAARAIREWERLEKREAVLMIALSGHDDEGSRRKCADAGFTGYLIKPAKQEELLAAILRIPQIVSAFSTPSQEHPSKTSVDKGDRYREKADHLVTVDPDLEELIPSFMKKMGANLTILEESIRKNDFEEARAMAHRLKGSSNVYGFTVIGGMCEAIENSVKAKDSEKAIGYLEPLKDYLANVRIEFKKE